MDTVIFAKMEYAKFYSTGTRMLYIHGLLYTKMYKPWIVSHNVLDRSGFITKSVVDCFLYIPKESITGTVPYWIFESGMYI